MVGRVEAGRGDWAWSGRIAASVALALALAACGSANVKMESTAAAASVQKPERIVVEDFAVAPDAVELDGGVGARLMRAVSSKDTATREREAGRKVVTAISTTLVEELNATGIPAVLAQAAPMLPPAANALVVSGEITDIDEGNRTRRNLVGFGVGASKVTAEVAVNFVPRGGAPVLVRSMNAEAESGRSPGLVTTGGVGAVAGRAATAAAAGVGKSVASEQLGAGVDDNGRRMAKEIAAQLRQYFVDAGWVAAK
jgi:hypothetical protein